MHETAIAHSIISKAKEQGEVEDIYLEIGELAHVPMPELLSCMKGLVPWNIHAIEKKAIIECSCGFKGSPIILEKGHDFFLIECPECHTTPDVVEGKDIRITKVGVR